MSVLIKGMGMPKNCFKCKFSRITPNWYAWCSLTEKCYPADDPPPDVCPLVKIPPHGDLIDRREAIIDANERAYDFWLSDDEVNATIQFLNEQPTIIPAEEQSGNSGELEDKP